MSKQKYNATDYFETLKSCASPPVKQELEMMERSKQNSFRSLQKVMLEDYGLGERTY